MRNFDILTVCAAMALVAACGGGEGGSDGGQRDGQMPGADSGFDAGFVSVCARESDCADSLFCNGTERCMPGTAGAGADGCVAGTPPCSATEVCDETAAECHADDCADGGDADGDGDARPGCGGHDCDDTSARVSSMAQEACDDSGVDEDCDPSTIYNDRTGANDGDRDGDGFVDTRCFNINDDRSENRGTDCDDMRASINPEGVEACDGRDNDCNEMIDEGVLETYYRDVDGDGYGDSSMTMMDCTAPLGWVLPSGDCNDGSGTIHPGATELCDGVVDQNCDDVVDDGCLCSPDGASRPCAGALGACAAGIETCSGVGGWTTCSVTASPEVCDGSTDENCNGVVDEGCSCVNGTTRPCGLGACAGTQSCAGGAWGSCSGASPTTETCDGIDSDCDGVADADDPDVMGVGGSCGSGTGECNPGRNSCSGGSLVCGGPGYVPPATEACDHLDNDCDGQIDDGVSITAECSQTFPPTRALGVGAYTCLPAGSLCSGVVASGTNGGEGPRAAYGSWSGDYGRANYFRARVDLRDASSDGVEPDGWVSFVLVPTRTLGGDSIGFTPGGLPALSTTERGIALSLHGDGYSASLWRYRGAYWDTVDSVIMPAACAPISTTTHGYTFEIINTGEQFIVRVSRDGCGTATMNVTPLGLWDDLYGSGPTAPRYYLGVVGDNDDDLSVTVTEMYIQRRIRTGDRNDCTGC